jgi:hypothetical protein
LGTSANKILELARAEIGVKEAPPGSNKVKYNESYYMRPVSGSGYAWCAVFLWWLFQMAGAPELYFDGSKTAYVPTLMEWAGRRGLLVDKPQPGDLICFDFNANNKADHIGICEGWDGQYVTTIDGNTGTTNEANGGCVMRRRRHKKYILAVIRPKYEEDNDMAMPQSEFNKLMDGWMATQGKGSSGVQLPVLKKGMKGKQVASMQILLIGHGFSCGSSGADGSFGPDADSALRRYQKARGLKVDGLCGPDTWRSLLGI